MFAAAKKVDNLIAIIDLNGKQIEYNQMKTLITPGLIAGDKTAVDKTLEVLKEK